MLRKRSRSQEKDQQMGNVKHGIASSDSNHQSDILSQRHTTSSFFSIASWLGRSNTVKAPSDTDSLKSPTSPLEFKLLPNLGNPFSFMRPKPVSLSVPHNQWGFSEVGLGIVSSLADEAKLPGETIASSKGKGVLTGPKCKVKIDVLDSVSHFHGSLDSLVETKLLPETPLNCSHSGTNCTDLLEGPDFDVGDGDETEKENEALDEVPFDLESWMPVSPTPTLAQNPNSNSFNFCSDGSTVVMDICNDPVGEVVDCSWGMQHGPIPTICAPPRGFAILVSKSEMELSEDYTRIVSRGPNPKTTHIYGDRVLDLNSLNNFEDGWGGIMLPPVTEIPAGSSCFPCDRFLSLCYLCKARLKGKDIYMYRGEKGFCSFECRDELISAVKKEKAAKKSSKKPPESSSKNIIFHIE